MADRPRTNPRFAVPTYEYRCKDCGHTFDAVQSFTDESLRDCPACAGDLRKVFGNVGITFKGSGFYKTDSRSGSSTAASTNGDGGDGGGGGSSAEGGSGGEKESKDSSPTADSPARDSASKDAAPKEAKKKEKSGPGPSKSSTPAGSAPAGKR